MKGTPSNAGITLAWKEPTKGAVPDGYRVSVVDPATGLPEGLLNVFEWEGKTPNCEIGAATLRDTVGYTRGATYQFQVTSLGYDQSDTEYESTPAVGKGVAGPAPAAPASLKAKTLPGGIGLTWKAPKGLPVDGYVVRASAASSSGFVEVTKVTEWEGGDPNLYVSGDDLSAAGLTYAQGATYYFQVFSFVNDPLGGPDPVESAKFAKASGKAG